MPTNSEPTTAELRRRPIVMVHTGEGKGKTTAAMGVALRTWAQGESVGVFQFVKSGKWRTGEHRALTTLAEAGGGAVEWEILGQGWSWIRTQFSEEQRAEAAAEGWRHVAQGIREERHRLWVLDEFTYPMTWGWVDPAEVADVLRTRPGRQHVIITGRNCPDEIVEVADLVTEMTKVKHPFDQGQRGQAGIEW